jgi:hypothetical protein
VASAWRSANAGRDEGRPIRGKLDRMSDDARPYFIVFPNERAARTFQFAVDAANGIPSPGTRVGRGHAGHRTPAGTVTHAGIHCDPSGVWLYDVFAGNDGLAQRMFVYTRSESGALRNLANLQRPDDGLDPNSDGAHWPHVIGFFREYLEDFFHNLPFDVVELQADAAEDGRWQCVAHLLAGDEPYVLGVHELIDLIRGVDVDASKVVWTVAIGTFNAKRIHTYHLQVPRTNWDAFPKLRARDDMTGVFDSLPGAYIFSLLAYIAMRAPKSGRYPLDYDEFRSHELRVNAARAFISAALSLFCREPRPFHVYDVVCALSERNYERRPATGSILFCSWDERGWIDWAATLELPILLTDIKRVRKLLETCSQSLHLISDSVHVFGIGSANNDRLRHYLVRFQGFARWSFWDHGQVLMEYKDGKPVVPAALFDYALLEQHVRKYIPSMNDEARQLFLSVVAGAVQQSHGTMVVLVTDQAEIQRLGASGFAMTPRTLKPADVAGLTSVDGALLLDGDGFCRAFGVILDGSANAALPNRERGARYNSAVRYVAEQRKNGKECIAVVVSEDSGAGPDLVPAP